MNTERHPDVEVEQAITDLRLALHRYHQQTGRQSALIVRDDAGFVYRALSGTPHVPDSVTDEELLGQVTG